MMGDPIGIFWINKLHRSSVAVSSVEHIELRHLLRHQILSGMLKKKKKCSKLLADRILFPCSFDRLEWAGLGSWRFEMFIQLHGYK